jgi:methyltransferase (TIGR00027 family)
MKSSIIAAEPPAYFKPLHLEPDEEDLALHRRNCDPELVTRRLRALVPLLDFIDCKVERITRNTTVLNVPLLESAMNQNGTHQASVFYLLADYTLGVAMYGALPGTYVTGVHDRCRALPVQLWLKRGAVRHLAPGTGSITAEASIGADAAIELRRQLIEKGRCELHGLVRIFQEGRQVAETEHVMGAYVDAPRSAGTRVNVLQLSKLKTSGLMIAGLRDDPISRALAGEQGSAIANRMALAMPQLPALVRARSQHVEHYLAHTGSGHAQVLVLGVGLDPKPLRFSSDSQRWFGLDLKEMLEERQSRLNAQGVGAGNFTAVAADIRSGSWEEKLLGAGFEPGLSTLVILEGMSMYFEAPELRSLLRRVRSLVAHPASRLWLDHATEAAFRLDRPDVRAFFASMARLGEPFVLGFENADSVCQPDWVAVESRSAAEVMGQDDEVLAEYRFSLLQPSPTASAAHPA